ncbi:hypothetical protein AKJ09_05169 [Labilithrix luteola]|uniref:Uncharacterized protein n=1 Tax=Labilithrix luteola TaxID=1391654 RepID=A0A0K1PY96_9BACT|nr:hypothetical protein AKJ09_05169 [Labilithrix luteola]
MLAPQQRARGDARKPPNRPAHFAHHAHFRQVTSTGQDRGIPWFDKRLGSVRPPTERVRLSPPPAQTMQFSTVSCGSRWLVLTPQQKMWDGPCGSGILESRAHRRHWRYRVHRAEARTSAFRAWR